MLRPTQMVPWWIISAFAEGPNLDFSAAQLSSLLSHQLEQWSIRSKITGAERKKWWRIDSLNLPVPQKPEEIYDRLTEFVRDKYPLRRRDGKPPHISGPIDDTKLTIALVGDVRDPLSRAYLHCLGRLIRMEGLQLLDAIDINLLALIYLPNNTHQYPDRDDIARFLAELHTMMLQPAAHLPFNWVFFLQDKNNSSSPGRSGYDPLSSSQVIELMAQALFHSMISEGETLREIARNYAPAYLSLGSVAVYYDWDQHKQKLAKEASRTLINRFAFSREAPFINEIEAVAATTHIKGHFATDRLLEALIQISKSISKRMPPGEPSDERKGRQSEAAQPEAHADREHRLYKEMVRRSSRRVLESSRVLWKGGWETVNSTERIIIESVREIFAGGYGTGSARTLEQALLVLNRLKEIFDQERDDLYLRKLDDSILLDLLEPFDLDSDILPPDDKQPPGRGPEMSALALYQLEWLLAIPLWAKLLGSLLFASSGLFLFRKIRSKYRNKKPAEQLEQPLVKPQTLSEADKRSLQEELRKSIDDSLISIYYQAKVLVRNIEIFIIDVRGEIEKKEHNPDPLPAYRSTTFCRSVFDELIVPGRFNFGRLISNGDFTPQFDFGPLHGRFEEFDNRELHLLINEFLNDQKSKAITHLPPPMTEDSDLNELSIESTQQLLNFFYDFALELYDLAPRLGMDDALWRSKKSQTQDNLIAFAAQAASPPIIFSRSSANKAPVYVEWKYHNLELLDEVYADRINGQWGKASHTEEKILDGDLLSLGVYQPILPSRDGNYSSLDSIHTISMMQPSGSLAVRTTPSLVFTLATLAPAPDRTAEPVLISPLNGQEVEVPTSIADDVSLFKQQLRNQEFGPLVAESWRRYYGLLKGSGEQGTETFEDAAGETLPPDIGSEIEEMKSVTKTTPLYINLWLQDDRQIMVSLPAILISGWIYEFFFAVEPFVRGNEAVSAPFSETESLSESETSPIVVEVLCSFLDSDPVVNKESGYERRETTYVSGIGFRPLSFKLKPNTPGRFYLTARLLAQGETIYREVLTVEVVADNSEPQMDQAGSLYALPR